MPNARRFRVAVALVTTLVALAACGGGSGAAPEEQSPPGYPRTVDNCGTETRVDRPPHRAVSLNQGSTEILLSLGLGERLAGTATWTDPVLPELAEANADVPRLAENNPSFEAVLAAEPDFVSASFVSTLGVGGVATREQFHDLDVPTYVAPSDCVKDNDAPGDGRRDEPLDLATIYGEIRDLAHVFGVEERGERLVAELRDRVATATEGVDASGVSVLYWFANKESPYLAGCCGAPGIITRALGLENVFDDTHDEWPQINWETVADRNPDVLVLGDLTRRSQTAESAERKIEFLESHPVTREMDAVRDQRYILLSGQALNPSIRTVDGIETLATALGEFGLTR
ncbi:ABC transporter substrate-binding protein [Saccharomonospora saliphila]|uniref:ABC transporter substrate-binding protein n=1 Tax=Saccharomonospora saliphila TaxID=369829 RepID=UPI000382028D|nr:ABC transporter substrate-binding protein [Saccharomonospora saliphila]